MKLFYISDSYDNDEIRNKIKLNNITIFNSSEFLEKQKYYANVDYLLLIDNKSVNEEYIAKIKENKKPESIIIISETLDWDKLIETFKKGETFYVKPIKEEDFKWIE